MAAGALCANLACGDEGSDPGSGFIFDGERDAHERPLLGEPATAAVATQSGAIAFDLDGATVGLWRDGVLRALPSLAPPLLGAADTSAGVLIASGSGLSIVRDADVATAQLIDKSVLGSAVALVESEGPLWIVAERGVARVKGDRVQSARPAAPWAAPPTSAASTRDGRYLFLVVEQALLRVEVTVDGLRFVRVLDGPVSAVAIGRDTGLVLRGPAGLEVWDNGRVVPAPSAIGSASGSLSALVGHARGQVWARTEGGLIRFDGTAWTRVRGIDPDARLLAATADGGALVSGPTATVQHAGPAVGFLEALSPVVREALALNAWVTRPADVERILAAVDGEPLEPDPQGRYLLAPDQLGFGERTLTLTAFRGAEVYAQSTYRFRSEPGTPPTWTQDIAPLFEAKCALCHGEQASARPLFTRDSWVRDIEDIVVNVTTGRMPLPPVELLSSSEVAALRAWRDAGFPE